MATASNALVQTMARQAPSARYAANLELGSRAPVGCGGCLVTHLTSAT